MPYIQYKSMIWSSAKTDLIDKVKRIILENSKYKLTIRQIYYKMFAKRWFPEKWADPKTGSTNNPRSYQKLIRLISDARLCGVLDWHDVTDITRELGGNAHWQSPASAIFSASHWYAIDKWEGQEFRPEIWVEKDAIENVAALACNALDVPYFSCRGYTSLDAIWRQAQRLKKIAKAGYTPVILHFGDHDPSGIDMSRDIGSRVRMFMDGLGEDLVFERLALNMDQIKTYSLPVNPTKFTDPRAKDYRQMFGDDSWELDALDASVVDTMIRENVARYRDDKLYAEREAKEAEGRRTMELTSEHWSKIEKIVKRRFDK